jgi:hypothetical protein
MRLDVNASAGVNRPSQPANFCLLSGIPDRFNFSQPRRPVSSSYLFQGSRQWDFRGALIYFDNAQEKEIKLRKHWPDTDEL